MEMYKVQCHCGGSVAVGLHQCGLDLPCPACGIVVRIPDNITLKTLNEDPYPSLRYIEKIQCAARDHIVPFDGACIACGSVGTNEVPVVFSELMERIIEDDGGVRPGMFGAKLVVGKGESVFLSTSFPIILCDQCVKHFKKSRPSSYLPIAKWILFIGIVAAVFQFVFEMWIVTLVATLLVVGNLLRFRNTGIGAVSAIPKWLEKWVQHIRWFPEAAREAMEFHITVGEPRTLKQAVSDGA